jgi:sigma-E factor negative regulatory protein RseB
VIAWLHRWRIPALVCLLWAAHGYGMAQSVPVADDGIQAWLMRVHEASRYRSYSGTFVVSAAGSMASARIWHVSDGQQQVERVESLSGKPRATFRRNDQVVTFFPESKIAVVETRESLGQFPGFIQSTQSSIGETYQLKRMGGDRIAGFDADVVQLVPNDNLRFGYRVWSEKRTGLVMQLQTLDRDGRVLEQSAFSELQLDTPVSMGKLHQMMGDTRGFRIERPDLQKITPESQGWALQRPVKGFQTMGCYRRLNASAAGNARADGPMQWVFSDGLATVSLFVEPFDPRRHVREGHTNLGGPTNTLTRHLGEWWATVVGEVPLVTLMAFTTALERK